MGLRMFHSILSHLLMPFMSSVRYIRATAALSCDRVSGKKIMIMRDPRNMDANANSETWNWLRKSAIDGAIANPTLKPANTKPNDGALHRGGSTSDSADREMAT